MGFNMSWIFVDETELNELYTALDVKSTGETADPYDLGTGRVPLAGLKPKAGWCAGSSATERYVSLHVLHRR